MYPEWYVQKLGQLQKFYRYIMIILEGEEREKETEEILEVIVAKNVPKLVTYTINHTPRKLREAGWILKKKKTPIFKRSIFKEEKDKDKEKTLKEARA